MRETEDQLGFFLRVCFSSTVIFVLGFIVKIVFPLRMGNGDRTGFVGSGDDSRKTSSFECDVGLGLKMQPTESESLSFSCPRKMMRMPHHPSYENSSGGYAGDEGGGPVFCSLSNQVACVNDIHNVVGASSLSGATVLPRSSHTFTANTSFRSSGQALSLYLSSSLVIVVLMFFDSKNTGQNSGDCWKLNDM